MSDWKMNGKAALLILHMQNGIAGLHRELLHTSGVIANQQALLKAFRAKKLPVIYVNVLTYFPLNDKLPAYGFLWQHVSSSRGDPKDMEVMSEIAPMPDEQVLINWPTGAFNNSGLDTALRR